MNAVAYIWRGLINCFYLFVILYVFDNIQDKNTSIIIAVLALLYTTMRTIAGGQALTFLAMGRGLHEEFADLKVKMGTSGRAPTSRAISHAITSRSTSSVSWPTIRTLETRSCRPRQTWVPT